MEQLRLLEVDEPAPAEADLSRGAQRPRTADWHLDAGLRLLGRRKVVEARRVLDETRRAVLAEAS